MKVRRGVVVALFAVALLLTGCGGGSSTPPPPQVFITVTPLSIVLQQGGTQQFTATVSGSTNTEVRWSVQEGPSGGTISATGLYTAPNTSGTYHVVATSQADTRVAVVVSITVPTISVVVTPSTQTMSAGETFTFHAIVNGTTNPGVTWSVQEGASGGTVSQTGLYTAPGTLGTYHVVATSVVDTSKSGAASVTIAPVSVSVSPLTALLGPFGVRAFTATVSGTTNPAVTWNVAEGAAFGSVAADGTFSGAGSTGTAHVTATSVKDPTKTASATVTLVAAGFRPTGGMSAGRSAATATLLNDGKVLIAGGSNCFFSYYYYYSCGGDLDTAELYDPTTGTFSATGKMTTARTLHTATLLKSGKVLLAGGASTTGSSAELYDPATGTFTATGSMTIGRREHTATLLGNDKVLITGGSSVGPAIASAELYDPAAGTFAATGSMSLGRSGHTATLLPNGKVLVAGGISQSGLTGTAEVYDPTPGTFSSVASMSGPRSKQAAVMLSDGTSRVLIAGGWGSSGPLATAELFNPATNTFSSTGSMAFARGVTLGALLPGGNVLVFSGQTLTAEVFDVASGTFSQTGGPQVDHQFGALARLADGRILVAGGAGKDDLVDTNICEIYQ